MSFLEIELFLTELRREQYFYRYLAEFSRQSDKDITLEYVDIPLSNDVLTHFYIEYFRENEEYFNREMSDLTATWLSCDHTFKIASNIGLLRGGKWMKQYDSLFAVMNELGQVVTWQFVYGQSYSTIETLLTSLKSKLDKKGCTLQGICIDNCCHWRKKKKTLKEITKLEKHIEKGCLSYIPSSIGPNKNENMHRSLNQDLKKNRIGVMLALAILSQFFYSWNQRKSHTTHASKGLIPPTISQTERKARGKSLHTENDGETFGIGIDRKNVTEENEAKAFQSTECNSGDVMNILFHIREQNSSHNRDESEPCQAPLQHSVPLDEEYLTDILYRSVCMLRIGETISNLSKSNSFKFRDLGFMDDFLKTLHASGNDENEENEHQRRLDSVLKSYGFLRRPRKRARHDAQLNKQTSLSFMTQRGERVREDGWTNMEHCVFVHSLRYIEETEGYTIKALYHVYNTLVKLIEERTEFGSIRLVKKTEKELVAKYSQHCKEAALIESLMK
ncbi:hypothetical protein ACROYT_G033308 [Oculina patagonica]